MTFVRKPAHKWQREIPGARWFKADLHIHTVDDLGGGKAKMPREIGGAPADPASLRAYALRLLQRAASRGVQVLGLTPHCPRMGSSAETSAVWKVVEEWNSGVDDDGIPFREKIYAVFPGFEPSIKAGRSGVHLIFLFDPEIGRERYLSLFEAIMDARSPWRDGGLALAPRGAEEIFKTLDRHEVESRRSPDAWSYLVLAPHFLGEHGLLREVHSQVLEVFPCKRIAAFELGDQRLPEDLTRERRPGSFLLPFMERNRQAFFHGSDAYTLEAIGGRYTWLKLATPRIEALRQAFLASDARLRIGFVRGADGLLEPIPDPPDATWTRRPWLKRVIIRGGASFFGGTEGGVPRETTFALSPDLTCLIGGSMTGKSTFLDGLRVHVSAPLPKDEWLRKQVLARGQDILAAGTPEIILECPGRDPTAPPHERWPARFFTQGELQRLSQEASAVEEILARLAPAETAGIQQRKAKLSELDRQLEELADSLTKLDEQVTEAEQARDRACAAKDALAAFAEAGVERLHQAGRDRQTWTAATQAAEAIHRTVAEARASAEQFEVPEIAGEAAAALEAAGLDQVKADLRARWPRIHAQVDSAVNELARWVADARKLVAALENHEAHVHSVVERALAEQGLEASKLKEFQELSRQAGLLPSYEDNLQEMRARRAASERAFSFARAERERLVQEQREAFDRVIAAIEREFGSRIRVRRIDCGDDKPVEGFLKSLRQSGSTRWWNELVGERRPSPAELLGALEDNRLDEIGMSDAVQQTFRETMTRARRRKLEAVRSPDRYLLEMRMDDGSYRRLDELSGGQQVSVLLSLLLETSDDRPLVIDQPEDQLDNRFLFETVLPALKRLKGKRQVIVATHNANIVVNGDADLVIQLEATACRGRIACAGAIEDPGVRGAILRTVDGGKEAFLLRRRKYGF